MSRDIHSILFVCTGNSCRSPMAEYLAKHHLGAKVKVASAGTCARVGGSVSQGAVVAMHCKGLDVRRHRSQPLTRYLVEQFEYIVTMENHHKQMVLSLLSEPKVFVITELAGEGLRGIGDPIGASDEEYIQTALEIEKYLLAWWQEF